MAWRETCIMDQKMCFIVACMEGEDITELVLSVRHRYPNWGPRKVKAWLEARHPWTAVPAASTIGALFDRAGLTRPRKRRRRVPPSTAPLAACHAPNDV